jgi:hypothetical protein
MTDKVGCASTYLWGTPKEARHSFRVICDEQGLSVKDKNLLCAVATAESGFNVKATNQNKDKAGKVLSTDYGIVQINDYWWIGKGKYFASVDEVLNKPEKSVLFMIAQFRAGHIGYWCAFTNSSYKKFL